MTKQFLIPVLFLFASGTFVSCNSKGGSDNTDPMEAGADDDAGSDENRRYMVKSATYTTKTSAGTPGQVETTTMYYFEDYGEKEYSETTSKVNVMGYSSETHGYSLRDGMIIYSWNEGQTTGTRMDISKMLDKNLNYEKMSEEMKKQFKYTEIGTETILGKTCKKATLELQPGNLMEIAMYKGIPMRSKASMMGMTAIIETIAIDENPSGMGDKLKVPSGITFTEMTPPPSMQ